MKLCTPPLAPRPKQMWWPRGQPLDGGITYLPLLSSSRPLPPSHRVASIKVASALHVPYREPRLCMASAEGWMIKTSCIVNVVNAVLRRVRSDILTRLCTDARMRAPVLAHTRILTPSLSLPHRPHVSSLHRRRCGADMLNLGSKGRLCLSVSLLLPASHLLAAPPISSNTRDAPIHSMQHTICTALQTCMHICMPFLYMKYPHA